MRSGLINLQKIYLSRCQLSHINSRAFRGLSNLVDLDLSHNVLGEVPSPAFPDCQGLMKLILSGNPIRTLPKKAFIALQSLTTLEMSHCEIERIEKVSCCCNVVGSSGLFWSLSPTTYIIYIPFSLHTKHPLYFFLWWFLLKNKQTHHYHATHLLQPDIVYHLHNKLLFSDIHLISSCFPLFVRIVY